jgi:cytochrome b
MTETSPAAASRDKTARADRVGTLVWDPFVRLFHWSLVGAFTANALLNDPEGKAHEVLGYAILALVVLRLVWGVVGTRHARFASFPPSLRGALGHLTDIATGRQHATLGHNPLGALMVYNLLLALLVISVSGHMMTMDAFWGLEWPEDLHEAAVTWAEVSVLAHVAGVIFESRRSGINLARAMVTGYKRVNRS